MVVRDHKTDVALWRYAIIASLLTLDRERGPLAREIRRLSSLSHEHPKKGAIKVGYGTIEDWLYRYKKSGLDALADIRRRDHGKSRAIDDDLATQIEELAQERKELDGPGILQELKAKLEAQLKLKAEAVDATKAISPAAPKIVLPSLSTLYRFLRAHGLDQRNAPTRKDHRAFVFDLAGDCWQGDVMYGPSLPTKEGGRRKAYLIAILDDATRVIVHAQFYFEQHLRSLKDCLKQALLKRGVPRRFYFDNGRIFRSRLLLQIAARLGIQLIHTRPYQPQGRAKLERWFLTVRRAFLARLDLSKIADLDELNRQLFTFIEQHYHLRPHRGLGGATPPDRWLALSDGLRPLPRDVDLDQLFLEEAARTVAKDGTFSLNGKFSKLAAPEVPVVLALTHTERDCRLKFLSRRRHRWTCRPAIGRSAA